MKSKYIITALILLLFFVACGSKKSVSQSQVKEKTDIELTDNSKINTKIETEKQYVNTNTKERIVTYYGVRFDTIYVDGEPVVTPTSYPVKKEEDREIVAQMIKDLFTQMDSTQNAVELKYKSQLDEKDKQISEFKETKTLYHIGLIVIVAGFILLQVLRR